MIHIDNFTGGRSGVFFLTHWHSDHTKGLTNNWSKGVIYCSSVTKKVLQFSKPSILNIHTLAIGLKTKIDNIFVTAYKSNHLAGSIMLYFEFDKNTVLYTGDYRYNQKMVLPTNVQTLFIDNTFNNTSHLLTLQRSTDLTISWLNRLNTYRTLYIGFFSTGTCELLKNIHLQTGLKFDISALNQETYDICNIMYSSNVWSHKSKIKIVPGFGGQTTAKTPILYPSSQWWLYNYNGNNNDIVTDGTGVYRVNFTTHSDKCDNLALIKRLKNPIVYNI
jgi:hypothetical protein